MSAQSVVWAIISVTHVKDGVTSVKRHRVLHLLLSLGTVRILRLSATARY